MFIFQIVHCSVGLVRSNVVLTAFQVFSRVFLTWGIVYSVEAVGRGTGVKNFQISYIALMSQFFLRAAVN